MIEDYSKYPRYYYKYLCFGKNTIHSFINSEFWFSDPRKFNDPYDCKVELDFDFNEDELKEWYAKTNKFYTTLVKSILTRSAITTHQELEELFNLIKFILKQPDLPLDEFFGKIDTVQNKDSLIYPDWIIDKRIDDFRKDPLGFVHYIENVAKEEIKFYRIFCLSRTKNSSTMWAHYADNHKGICIQFDLKADEDFFTFPLKVDYKGRYPKYNYVNEWEQHAAARFVLRTKHKSWIYEKEFRIVKDIRSTKFKNKGLYKINRSAIKEVYFGLNANNVDIELFKEINHQYYSNKIKIFKAVQKEKSFDIGFIRL